MSSQTLLIQKVIAQFCFSLILKHLIDSIIQDQVDWLDGIWRWLNLRLGRLNPSSNRFVKRIKEFGFVELDLKESQRV